MEDLTGKQLGQYQIVSQLGKGGMATVYKAFQPSMERYVAVKLLPRDFAEDPQFVKRFKHEAKAIAQLQHPNILPVYDFSEADGYTYIVMPFINGGTLTELTQKQSLSIEQSINIISQIGSALDYAHAHGILHRDVKPSNVLIDEHGTCLLSDFGLAKVVEGNTKYTATGSIIGTPDYMSPEQGRGDRLDSRSDIYSLGIMLFELATGYVPFQAETPIGVIIKHIQDPLPSPRSLNPNIPESIEPIIGKALAKDPEDRFTTAKELVEALQAAIRNTTRSSMPMPLPPTRDPLPTLIASIMPLPPISDSNPKPTVSNSHTNVFTKRLKVTRFRWVLFACATILVLGIMVVFRTAFFSPPSLPSIANMPVATSLPTSVAQPSVTPLPTALLSVIIPTTAPIVLSPTPIPTASVFIQDDQNGLRTGVGRGFVADVWINSHVGDPGVNGDRQTQLIMGEHVLIVGETNLWYQIVIPDQPSSKDGRGYPGWIQKSDIMLGWPITTEYAIVTDPIASVFDSPNGQIVKELPFDARFSVLEKQGAWIHVYLPDGAKGWINSQSARVTSDLSARYEPQTIISTAKKFLGTPYVWGGMTAHGLDCSGFVYRVFHVHGITLSRDSRDMSTNGQPDSHLSLLAGDLVFTTSRSDGVVSHVALYAGDGQIIATIGTMTVGESTLKDLVRVEQFVTATRIMR